MKEIGDPDTSNKNIQSDIGINFPIEQCAKLIMKSVKRQITEGIQLPLKKESEHRRKRKLQYLEILVANAIKYAEMKEKILKEYLRRTRKLLEIKLCSRKRICLH